MLQNHFALFFDNWQAYLAIVWRIQWIIEVLNFISSKVTSQSQITPIAHVKMRFKNCDPHDWTQIDVNQVQWLQLGFPPQSANLTNYRFVIIKE